MDDLGRQIEDLTAIIYTLAAVVAVLCGYIVTLPIAGEPPKRGKAKAVEHCKLHARPLSECIDQHKAD